MDRLGDFREKRWLALILLCSAQFVVVLDASIVNVALPTIGKALDFSQENLPWVVNAYVLTFGGFLLLGGRTADLLGRRRVFMAGLLLVAVASLAAGFAATEGQLIAARAAQGLGAAIISPAALSIVTTTFSDGAERNKALGVWGAVAGSGGAAGVLLGGILTDGLGWEWVLWVNVPVSLIAFALTPRLIAESRAERRDARLRRRRRGHRHRGALDPRLRAGRRQQRRLGLEPDDRPDRALAVCCWPPSSRSSCARRKPLVPFSIFRIRTPDRRQRRRPPGRRLALLDVLLHLALHAAGARLQRDPRRPLLPAAGAGDHGLGRDRLAARSPSSATSPCSPPGCSSSSSGCLVQPGLGRRQLHHRHPRPVAARRGRARLRLRDDDDRGGLRRRGKRGRASPAA